MHWRGQHPLDETFAAFEQLKREGKILSWGVSNFDVSDLEEAWKVAGGHGLTCNQVLYHLQQRAIEHAVIPWCERHGVAVVAYSPFAHGSFPGPRSNGYRVLEEIAASHAATPHQVALRFLVRSPALFTIPKASSPEHAAYLVSKLRNKSGAIPRYYQLVLRVKFKGGVPIETSYVLHRELRIAPLSAKQ